MAAKVQARDLAPAELLRKLQSKISSLNSLNKHSDYRAEVLAELRAGNPVIVARAGFTWEGELYPRLSEFNPGPEFAPRVAQLMESMGRYFVTKAYMQAMDRLKLYEDTAASLAPLVADVSRYTAQASQARAQEAEAKQAEAAARKAAEAAEAELDRADKAAQEYVKSLAVEIH